MRVAITMVGVFTLGVSLAPALAQTPAGTMKRGAHLLPPIPLESSEIPLIARGVADELPQHPDSTPVTRSATNAAAAPAWLGGSEPNIRLAGGMNGATSTNRQFTPPPDDPSAAAKGSDKLKGNIAASAKAGSRPGSAPAGQPTADTPFRSVTPGGSPVYAGPPAYRWYGWGSVTPGANPNAPAGNYPRASANWYSITGATPGAFPVPVMNPLQPPGAEPPAYVANPTPRAPVAVYAEPPQLNVPTPTISSPPMPQYARPPENKLPPPSMPTPVAVPTLAAPPAAAPPVPPPAPPIGVEAALPATPPASPIPATSAPLPVATTATRETPHPTMPSLPVITWSTPVPTHTVETPNPFLPPATTSSPLPATTMDERAKWQPGASQPTAGEWTAPSVKPR